MIIYTYAASENTKKEEEGEPTPKADEG